MAKVNGPLLSNAAAGTLAGALTFLPGPGPTRVRSTIRSSQPTQTKLRGTQAMFGFLAKQWSTITAPDAATWEPSAIARRTTPENEFRRTNLTRMTEGLAPTKRLPIAAGANPTAAIWTLSGAFHHAHHGFSSPLLGNRWGVLIYRSLTSGFTVSPTLIVAVYDLQFTGGKTFDDIGLTPGTYFYRARLFSDAAKFGTLLAQKTAVVT